MLPLFFINPMVEDPNHALNHRLLDVGRSQDLPRLPSHVRQEAQREGLGDIHRASIVNRQMTVRELRDG